ncbi:MAG: hypothetical protein GX247_03425 [Mollicutes bacterium]|nr:hypothetical protein [Mollicutes bacterium]
MDDQGWGLRTMLGLCAILAFFLLLIVINIKSIFGGILYNSNTNDDKPGYTNQDYQQLESKLIDGAKKYIKEYYSDGIPEGVKLVFTVKDLQNKGFLEEINDPNNKNITCSGYINVEKESSMDKYYPYIKCGNKYGTKGYNKIFDD